MTQRGAMGGPPGRTQAKIERIARKNAELLGEELELGVHMLKDGRIRVYLLDHGWRRWPYREYHSADSALRAARTALARAKRIRALIDSGTPKLEAVRRFTGGWG